MSMGLGGAFMNKTVLTIIELDYWKNKLVQKKYEKNVSFFKGGLQLE